MNLSLQSGKAGSLVWFRQETLEEEEYLVKAEGYSKCRNFHSNRRQADSIVSEQALSMESHGSLRVYSSKAGKLETRKHGKLEKRKPGIWV